MKGSGVSTEVSAWTYVWTADAMDLDPGEWSTEYFVTETCLIGVEKPEVDRKEIDPCIPFPLVSDLEISYKIEICFYAAGEIDLGRPTYQRPCAHAGLGVRL
jgi:hypothetical protein